MKREGRLVSLVYLVCFVCLVVREKLDEQDRPDEPDQPALPALRATIVFPHPAKPLLMGVAEAALRHFSRPLETSMIPSVGMSTSPASKTSP